ncbi:MAG TPA: hypothetical protein VHO06_05595, partial [Polyangia bacterium]|nr:hypothetical protein [Polyangia bacterium]
LGGCGFKPNDVHPTTGTGGTPPGIDGGGSGGATGTGGSTPTGPSSLTLSPQSATMTVSNTGAPQTQQYMVSGLVNGQTVDLTGQATFSVLPAGIVTIDGTGLATSTGTAGGVVTVTARVGSVNATAKLTVHYTFTGVDPMMTGGISGDPSTIFTTTTSDATRAPGLVYPNDGVLFPPNITGIEIHFTPGSTANTLFEVSLTGPLVTVNAFIRCTAPTGINGCIYTPAPALWQAVAAGNAGQGMVALVVRGTDDTGTSVGDSGTFHMQFAQDNIDGALYYWTTSGASAIMRWDFSSSATGQTAQPYLTPTNTDGKTCVGCHALAPDGSKLVASAGGQGDGRLLLWNVSTNLAMQAFPLTQRSQFESWNADGTQFVGVYGDKQSTTRYAQAGQVNLMIFDGMTGAVAGTIDLAGARGDHPDWSKSTTSPNTIVFTSADPTAPTSDQHPATGGIDYVQYDGTAWGAPQTLVPSLLGKNRYYPAIAPDGNLVVYDESTCTAGTPTMGTAPDKSCDADTDATATMFLTSIMNPGAPIALANANGPGVADGTTTALTNSFPKWSPFIEQLNEQQQLVWLTFSSTRQYGLRSPPASASSSETKVGTLIWMVGIAPGVGGGDPSFTAFCLPFQDITTSNHIAQWAKYFLIGPG